MASRRERRAFIELLRCRWGAGDPGRLAALMRGCDADRLYALAAESGIGGLLSEICGKPEAAAALPTGFSGRLSGLSGSIALRNELIGIATAQVLSAFNENGVQYILPKGLAAVRRIYGGDALRLTSDIDMFIPREEFASARGLLSGLGFYYSLQYINATGITMDESRYLMHNNEAPFERRSGFPATGLDVHFELGGFLRGSPLNGLFPVNGTDWFMQAETIEVNGVNARCLNIEASLFYMMMHFSLHHSFMGVKWLTDLCEAAWRLGNEIDWNKIYSLASNRNLKRIVAICLRMVSNMTGINRFGEYSVTFFAGVRSAGWFMGRLFDDPSRISSKFLNRITRIKLPAAFSDRCKLIAIYLFHRSTVALRMGSGRTDGYDALQPFKLAAYAAKVAFSGK